jgi:CheY-like chemotaxis protein
MAKPVLLLVESNEEVLNQIQRDLERRYGRRYRVRAATSGREGLEELCGLKEDDDLVALVLADYQLPDMSGIEFLPRRSRRGGRRDCGAVYSSVFGIPGEVKGSTMKAKA